MSKKLSGSEKLVLNILRLQEKGALNPHVVWSRLPSDCGLKKDDVYKSLLSLTQKKFVVQVSKGQFMYIHPTNKYTGRMDITRNGDGYVVIEDKEVNDIYIPSVYLGKALPGDLVTVETDSGKKIKNSGRVITIVERSTKPVVGTIEFDGNHAWLLPDSASFPYDIYLTPKPNQNLQAFKASVRIKEFGESQSHPVGEILEVLGKSGSNEAEMHSIVAEFGFTVSFPSEVLIETESIPEEFTFDPLKESRRDFRNTLTFTIDPADAKDFDDAISFKEKKTGLFEVGVHIADVSHYVKPGTALDNEAFRRGTSVYLVDRTIPMLPEKLSNDLCSLKPNQDRFVFSAVFEIDSTGEVLHQWFGKGIIHSQQRFSYEDAQKSIETKSGTMWRELGILNGIAQNLNKARINNGAMSFESEEVKFELDNSGQPVRLFLKKRLDAHKLIEEFMLLANRRVAEFVKKSKTPEIPFIYRSHDSPSQEKLIELVKFCHLFGYKLDIANEKRLRITLNNLLEAVKGLPEEDVIVQVAIRSMAKALYTSLRSDHFGLAFDYYTHFTSPIRRYPDLLAHRILGKLLNGENTEYGESIIESIAKHASATEQKAAEAERASIKYKMAEYLSNHIGMVYEAVVSGVTEWGIFAEIIENHCEGMIRISDIKGDRFTFIEKLRKVRGSRTGRTFGLGDVISVRVKRADPKMRMIDFIMAD